MLPRGKSTGPDEQTSRGYKKMNQVGIDSKWLQPHLSSYFGVTKSCLETQTDLYQTALQPKDQVPQTLLYLTIHHKKKELGHASKET